MKNYFSIYLYSADNVDAVVRVLSKLYTEVPKDEIQEIVNIALDDEGGCIGDCLTEEVANEYADMLEDVGADISVVKMTDEQVKMAIEDGDIVEEDSQEAYEPRQYEPSEEDLAPAELYQYKREQMWYYMKFCMIGWAIATVGFCMMPFGNEIIGFLLVLAGVIVVDIPAFGVLRAGFGIGSLFAASGAVYEITYASGRKEYDYTEQNIGYVMAIITYLITLVVGVFAMLINIFKTFFEALAIKNENKLDVEFKDSIFVPPLFGIGVFIVGLIASGISGAVYEYQYMHPEQYSKDEIKEKVNLVKTRMSATNWSYAFYEYDYDTDTRSTILEVKYSLGAYSVEIGTYEESPLKLTSGTYLGNTGVWVYNALPVTDETLIKELNSFTLGSLVDFVELEKDINNVFAGDNYLDGWNIYWHNAKLVDGYLKLETNSDNSISRIVNASGIDEGFSLIEFKY